MATFRKVHVQFWSDPFIQELSPEQKMFYLYLLTNDRTKQCGIYEITIKQMSYDTGYSIDTVSVLLSYFIGIDKIQYNNDFNEIAIKNWNRYNNSDSPKVQILVNQELTHVKDIVLIEYLYGIANKKENKKENIEEERELNTVKLNKEKKEKNDEHNSTQGQNVLFDRLARHKQQVDENRKKDY